jgi:hypothetical protein
MQFKCINLGISLVMKEYVLKPVSTDNVPFKVKCYPQPIVIIDLSWPSYEHFWVIFMTFGQFNTFFL